MGENYTTNFKCKNCGATRFYTIPKGETVNDFLENKECEFCKCDILPKKNKEE